MSNIHSILPLIETDSWRWDRTLINQKTLKPTERKDLISSPKYPGFIYFGTISVSGEGGEQAAIELKFDNAETKRTLGRLFSSGVQGSAGIAPGVTRYDTDNDIYVAELSPTPPISYLDNAEISVRAPDQHEVTVDAFGIKLDILDADLFARSYERVISGELIEKMNNVDKRMQELNDNIRALGEALDANNLRDEVDVPDVDRERDGGFGF